MYDIPGRASRSISRRGLFAVTGAAAASVLVAGCGGTGGTGAGTTGAEAMKKALPNHVPSKAVTPDIPGSAGANGAVSDPAFLTYPANPARTVDGIPGSGGTYTTRTPLWGSIPPSSGNAYYDAVNEALGATLRMQPTDGQNYVDTLPPLFASDKLPDWLQIPNWANAKLNLGSGLDRFVDLTPHLSGSNVEKYPNLANIPPAAWQSGVWEGRLYGLPSYASAGAVPGYLFYRKDILAAAGVSPDVGNADDLFALGKQLTDANRGRWAFDDLWPTLKHPFGVNGKWFSDDSGKLVNQYETDGIIEALDFVTRIAKAGYVHPDALANNTQQGQQRFWSGNVLIQGGGTGGWDGIDAQGGTAANPRYDRQAFNVFDARGGTPGIELSPGASWFTYLNKRLSGDQVRECLAIANYLAAPYGSREYLLVNFGAEGIDYTMSGGNPIPTEQGLKEVAITYQFLVGPPLVTLVKNGFTQVVKDYAAWHADAVEHAVKPLFYGMNIAEPPQYASLEQPVEDTMKDVRSGRKTIDDYRSAVDTWRRQGGDQLRKFYEDIRDKYGTGQ
jgi:ABC-type glycerol-3-phosphate transport system substrate-binding protein